MSILLAVTLAAASAAQPVCSWDHPGVNPYKGRSGDAIDRYTDIPAAVRSTLRRRIEEQQPDDMVTITRDSISGKSQYDPAIRDMHFGAASVCATVTRSKWTENHQEPAAVYCVDKHCILVPKICGNVSRISRLPAAVAKNTGDRPYFVPANQARRELGGSLGDKDLGLADAAHSDASSGQDDPYSLVGDSAGLLDAITEAAGKRARLIASIRGTPAGHSLSEVEMAFDEDGYDIDPRGRAGRLSGHNSRFDIDDTSELFNPAPVPEADTWAMLLAGLGLVGFAVRRARRKQAGSQPD
ncbi:MHFG family PEP-CTERM protein [Duganella hordei]|uniref:MHFG family PEP-CTERM protein n=1 Tax=Duganella hordei TaxID=2865934 RepID=UPI0030E97211